MVFLFYKIFFFVSSNAEERKKQNLNIQSSAWWQKQILENSSNIENRTESYSNARQLTL